METTLLLDWPPTFNSYWLNSSSRGRFISKKGRLFRDAVIKEVSDVGANIKLDYNIMVDIIMFPPDNRVRDLDNYVKALLDALTHAELWIDDSLIDQLFVYRGETIRNGAVLVRVDRAAPRIPWDDRLIPLS